MRNFKPFTFLIILHLALLIIAGVLLIRQKGHIPQGKEEILVLSVDGVISIDKGSPLSEGTVGGQ
jgi:hypothetical protein